MRPPIVRSSTKRLSHGFPWKWARCFLAAWVLGMVSVRGAVSPDLPDGNTLFLFHLDENGGAVTTNLGTLGGNAYAVNMSSASTAPPSATGVLGAGSYPGFDHAANLNASGNMIGFDANGNGAYGGETAESIPMSRLNMGNGGRTPWTVEAMICPTITNANQEIVSTDSSANNRGFQFRLNAAGELEFNLISIKNADFTNPIPTLAADPVNGFATNGWYHVAAAYDGTNLVLYWTKVSATATVANPISTNAVIVDATFGAVAGPLVIGNENRGPSGENFAGLIDEVRISSLARPAGQMIFSPLAASPTVISPANPVYAGTFVTLSSTVGGQTPIAYDWQGDGGTGGVAWTNLSGAGADTYSLDTTSLPAGIYQYRLVVANGSGSRTNVPGTLNLMPASGPILIADTTIQPTAIYSGGSVLMSASFAGSGPMAYQWFFAVNGQGATLIPGATNLTYTLVGAQTNNSGYYYLTASNNISGLGGRTLASTPELLTVLAGAPPALTDAGMFCEFLEHPELTVISAVTPRFSWFYQPTARNDFQTGYRIIVASNPALAAVGAGDMWDSGMVGNSASINVPYGGSPLQANTSYYWRVQTRNGAGQTGIFSGIQQFNMAAQLSDPLATGGVAYQLPQNGSVDCYPPQFVAATPVLVTNTAPGDWFIDFGQDAFGYATVHANGNFAGTNVPVRFGEMASGNAVNTAPGGTIRYGTATLVLQNGDVVYPARPPSFNGSPDTQIVNPPTGAYGAVMPFRYLELTNFPGTLSVTDVVQERLATEFNTNAATFNSSSPTLNQVWALCRNSMEWLSFDGVYVDGDRERTPYEADTFIHQLSSYAVAADFTAVRCSFEYLTTHPTWPTEWKSHMIFAAWADYLQTGDSYLLAKYYPNLQLDSFTWAATAGGLMKGFPNFAQTTNSDIVDWPANDRDGFVINSGSYLNWTNAVNNAFYYRGLQLMANIAAVLGRTNDAATYAAAAAQVYAAYNATFWNSGSQYYVDGVGTTHASAHANFFPLAFGLVPAGNQAAVLAYLHARITANHGMPPSVYGAQYLLDALFASGDADTALGLMATNGPRSWMNMISSGSTLTTEAWSLADKSNEDWNHAWGAAAGNEIARHVLGVQPLTAGFGQVLIQPQLGQTLSFVQGTVPSIRGPISVWATNVPGQFQLLVNIPGNVTATIMLPASNAPAATAFVDGNVVSGIFSNNWLTITNIGSGQHALWVNTNQMVSVAALYNNWASSWFGANAANPTIAGQTADPDGDGFNNYDEFIAGTDPLDPGSRLAVGVAASSTNAMVMSVSGQAGRTYILQRSPGFSPSVWSNILTNGPLGTNQVLFFGDPSSPTNQAFYRLWVNWP